MSEVEVFSVVDYNPKYLDGSVESVISSIMYSIQSDEDYLTDFTLDMKDEVEQLPAGASKALLQLTITFEDIDEIHAVENLNADFQSKIETHSIYNITASSTETSKKYSEQY